MNPSSDIDIIKMIFRIVVLVEVPQRLPAFLHQPLPHRPTEWMARGRFLPDRRRIASRRRTVLLRETKRKAHLAGHRPGAVSRSGELPQKGEKQMAKNTKSTQIALAKQLIAGTSQHLANTSQLGFASATFTPAQVIASLQTLIDLRQGVDTAKATAKARLAEEKAKAPALRSFMAALESFVKVTFGNSPDVLADFGLHPRKARAPLKGTAKAAAAAKSKATRSAL